MGTNNQPRIVIVGPGAIGCLLACFLARAGRSVSLLDKRPERARLLSDRGLLLESGGASRRFMIPVAWQADDGIPCDFLFLCVKSFDTADAMRHALPFVGARTTIVSLQNGLGNIEAIAETAAREQVVCAVTGIGATVLEPGAVKHAGSGITRVAPFVPGGMQRALAAADILDSAGLEVECLEDVEAVRWSKLIVNAAINPLSVIYDVPNGRLAGDPVFLEHMRLTAVEGQSVARAGGIRLLYDDAARETGRICRKTGENLSSMLQDIRKHKPTEIDAINGAIVRAGKALRIPTPVNADLVKRIRRMENDLTDD